MMRGRTRRRVFRLVVLTGAFWAIGTAQAMAQPGCIGTIDGVPLESADSSGNAMELDADSVVSVAVSSRELISSVEIGLELGPFSWTTLDHVVDPPSNQWSGTLNVSEFSPGGVGLYHVIANKRQMLFRHVDQHHRAFTIHDGGGIGVKRNDHFRTKCTGVGSVAGHKG